ncbi:MAG: zf-HC2 domain-containing protein, partial [Actinobacteria bacterium]|nr:zf-HC2 domain-containing protein [Actinomycetota bacterium]
MPAAVTPSGVRDGDPAALAGLCAARGPSVLAYCRHVAGDADAAAAAADAFAAFRAAVIATPDLTGLNPEALLVSAVRRAAARRAPHDQLGVCAVVPLLLAARAEKTLSVADREVLEQHLESCSGCRAPVARFHAAERAYRDPPDSSIDLVTAATIVAAMASAAPATHPEPPVAATNGSGHRPAAATGGDSMDSDAGSDSAAAAGLVDQPTAAFQAAG